jgi:NADH dehydrogenase/NADH:ubiquinone oxidoreductase subunit G
METMIEFTIDGLGVEAEEGSTILPVALENGFEIPHLCYHDEVTPYGACRLCLVEVERGGRRRLTASCTYPVLEGIQVFTNTEKIHRARRVIIELLLARCPDREALQELASQMGIEQPRFEVRQEECILCGLCERVCREVVGADAISFFSRGYKRDMGPPFRDPKACIACGACVYVCPVDCIKMEETEEERTIIRWERTLPMKKCTVCGRSFAPWYQLEYIKERAKLPKDFLNICPDCRG